MEENNLQPTILWKMDRNMGSLMTDKDRPVSITFTFPNVAEFDAFGKLIADYMKVKSKFDYNNYLKRTGKLFPITHDFLLQKGYCKEKFNWNTEQGNSYEYIYHREGEFPYIVFNSKKYSGKDEDEYFVWDYLDADTYYSCQGGQIKYTYEIE